MNDHYNMSYSMNMAYISFTFFSCHFFHFFFYFLNIYMYTFVLGCCFCGCIQNCRALGQPFFATLKHFCSHEWNILQVGHPTSSLLIRNTLHIFLCKRKIYIKGQTIKVFLYDFSLLIKINIKI